MDRTVDWRAAVDAICQQLPLSQEDTKNLKSALIFKPVRRSTPFNQTAGQVYQSIQDLDTFIAVNKRDYIASGKYSSSDKDRIEEEVGLVVRTCTAQIERLKQSVLAAQQQGQQGQRRQEDVAAAVNQQTAVHLHGVVLVLVERLHGVSASFDKCRAVRYQQAIERDQRQQRKASNFAAGPYSQGRSSWQRQNGWSSADGTSDSSERQREQQQDSHGPQRQQQGQQQQQQVMEDQETQQLMEELTSRAQQAFSVERTMREVSTLNQMLSTAVMDQAEQIEQLYTTAVDATLNLTKGNESLRKAIRVNRSSRRYIFVLLLTASLLLLFYDWFNS